MVMEVSCSASLALRNCEIPKKMCIKRSKKMNCFCSDHLKNGYELCIRVF